MVLRLGGARLAQRAAAPLFGGGHDARLPPDVGRSGYHFGFATTALAQLYAPGCRRAIERAGGSVHTGAAVRQLLLDEGRFQGFALEDGRVLKAGTGVLALPPREAAGLLLESGDAGGARLAAAAAQFEPVPYVGGGEAPSLVASNAIANGKAY
jgi:hypothetical protein